jgi:hypothetical protein
MKMSFGSNSRMYPAHVFNITPKAARECALDIEEWRLGEWAFVTTVCGRIAAEERIEQCIREHRRAGNFSVDVDKFRAVIAKGKP